MERLNYFIGFIFVWSLFLSPNKALTQEGTNNKKNEKFLLNNKGSVGESGNSFQLRKMILAGPSKQYNMVVEIDPDYIRNIPEESGSYWDVAMLRLSPLKEIEILKVIGEGIVLTAGRLVVRYLNGNDPAEFWKKFQLEGRLALLFLKKESPALKLDLIKLKSQKGVFDKYFAPDISKGGFIAFPVEYGPSLVSLENSKVTVIASCSCQSFFGCKVGCCTSTSCKIELGQWCQENNNCKKVDATSSCACRKD